MPNSSRSARPYASTLQREILARVDEINTKVDALTIGANTAAITLASHSSKLEDHEGRMRALERTVISWVGAGVVISFLLSIGGAVLVEFIIRLLFKGT